MLKIKLLSIRKIQKTFNLRLLLLHKNIYKSLSGDEVSDNFKVGNGMNGFTKGVWINPNIIPINIEDKIISILLFDTEVNI